MTAAAQVLSTLKDVTGVQGSFVVSPEGTMLARDMSALFSDELLDELGSRLRRLVECFTAEGVEVVSCVLRYREHLVFVRSTPQAALCILSEPRVNMPALRMGASLVVRRLGAALEASARVPPPAAPSTPAPDAIQYRGSTLPRTP
jgi:predicted regulator of Ras-like GTPase activity (Roadblock/LC7/MglB family)